MRKDSNGRRIRVGDIIKIHRWSGSPVCFPFTGLIIREVGDWSLEIIITSQQEAIEKYPRLEKWELFQTSFQIERVHASTVVFVEEVSPEWLVTAPPIFHDFLFNKGRFSPLAYPHKLVQKFKELYGASTI